MSENEPPSSWESIRQSTFFWGCFGTAVAAVLAVAGTMMHDTRWLLALAWPFTILAVWEFARTFKWAVGLATIAGALISGAAIWFLYCALVPAPGGDPLYKGALAEIAVERPVQLADGTYSFPTLIKSVGDSPMINYQFVLSNSFWPSLLSKEQEDERFYRNAVSTFEKDIKNNPQPQEVGKVLRPGAVYRAFVPTAKLTQEHYNDIASGRMYMYIFIILNYSHI